MLKRIKEPSEHICEVCSNYLQQLACETCSRPFDQYLCTKCGAGYEEKEDKDIEVKEQ